ncbi:hypothetical protein [Frankia sp. ACN1ag]|uniref:hypothetical protein n=1 Tax=Frankia sp. ACN1ag TaxID=102891 RepID=UPI0006DC18C4|nr:hypothetical protein [Frankia sp. ACN1ag]KQC39053.1 hypothetical protein UK82_07720 [Frankia sp. ACN1ag]
MASAFADHFRTDAFASGHLVSGDAGRRHCEEFYAANRGKIIAALSSCVLLDRLPKELALALAGVLNSAQGWAMGRGQRH